MIMKIEQLIINIFKKTVFLIFLNVKNKYFIVAIKLIY